VAGPMTSSATKQSSAAVPSELLRFARNGDGLINLKIILR
jgi:hypothetical protein